MRARGQQSRAMGVISRPSPSRRFGNFILERNIIPASSAILNRSEAVGCSPVPQPGGSSTPSLSEGNQWYLATSLSEGIWAQTANKR